MYESSNIQATLLLCKSGYRPS